MILNDAAALLGNLHFDIRLWYDFITSVFLPVCSHCFNVCNGFRFHGVRNACKDPIHYHHINPERLNMIVEPMPVEIKMIDTVMAVKWMDHAKCHAVL